PMFNTSIGNIPASATDPFVATYPNGLGINNTFLGATTFAGGPSAPRMFEATSLSGQHPYVRYELMNKIYNNVTTRSNVFAVWITAGFFAVTDDTTQPVKLGAEIGAAQNQNIRHRMFAIIDRSNLVIAPSPATLTANVNSGAQQTFMLSATNGVTAGNIQWQIKPGTVLVVDGGAMQETVVVTGLDGTGNPIADFKFPHTGHNPPQPGDAAVTIPGNPGPQSLFNPADPA